MNVVDSTILITGGGSGIGLALAEEFLKLGNVVIVAGRSKDKLKLAASKGLKTLEVDLTKLENIRVFANRLIKEFPALNVVIHNAGIMQNEKLLFGGNSQIQDDTVATNILAPMRLTDALLPHLLKQKNAVIMTVSSGLAFAPLAMTPTYSASKAAVHSYTQSLRYQLKDTSVEVMELVPPYVQTHLMGDRQANDPFAMPLKEFISEVMQILKEQPAANEVTVKRVLPQRTSADGGITKYEVFFKQMNDQIATARKGE